MANRPVEDCPISNLPRVLAVVIQRLNVEGLLLPRALTHDGRGCSNDNTSFPEHCNDALHHGTQAATGDLKQTQVVPSVGRRLQPGVRNHSERIRSSPRRLITSSNFVTAVYKKPLSRQSSGERKKIAVNGYKVKETVSARSLTSTQPVDCSVLLTQREPCLSTSPNERPCNSGHDVETEREKSAVPVVAAVRDRVSKGVRTSTKSVRLASPPITRQSFVANRVGKRRRRNYRLASESGWTVGYSKPVPLTSLKTLKKKRKRISSEFIDRSEVSDGEEKGLKHVRELNNKRKGLSAKPPPRKRKKFNRDEVCTHNIIL